MIDRKGTLRADGAADQTPGPAGRRRTPAADRAVGYLERLVQQGQAVIGPRLPGIRQLALSAGVSYQTMWRAVRAMAARGALFPVHGAGINLRPSGRTRQPGERALPKWRRLAGALASDMVEGGYAAEELLPSAKELAGRYGADHKTMRKALGALVDDRILEPRPRGFRIVRRRPRARNTILFLTAYRLADLSLRSMETFWLGELIRCLEIECGKRNLRFVPVCFTGNEAEVRRVTGTETVLGCIADTPSSPDMLSTLLADLRAPIAVLDNVVSFRLCDTPDFSADRRATSFVIDQHAIGRQVGRYLHGLGHRSVAYIAPFTGFAFGRERFLGTYSVYRESGAQAGVKLFDVNPPDEGAAAPGAVLPLRPSRVAEELLSLRLTDIRAVLDITTPSAYQRRLREDLFPAFEDVLRQYSATAWACANDLVALQALRFFREKGIRVPQDISLIGFDNSEAALYSRLTSYSFDIPGMALRMLMRVLSPLGRTVSPPSERIVATTGTIVERETTGRPGAV